MADVVVDGKILNKL